jgi:hypothetical protein
LGVATKLDPLAQLEAQRVHFTSDDHIREEVAIWADASAEERLRELEAISADNAVVLADMDDERLERMRALRTLAPDTEAILEYLAKAHR